jgi:purine nucleosidase
MNYEFSVPPKKRVRLIIDTDCKNEADDQFALAHHLMTPKFEIKGIIAAHFEAKHDEGKGLSMQKSYDEILKVMKLMGEESRCPVWKGAAHPLSCDLEGKRAYDPVPLMGTSGPVISEGAKKLVEEAMKDDPLPLFAVFLGSLTDLASAYRMEPRIADRLTAIWIGGGAYPGGGCEFNLFQDIPAANIVFSSPIPLWQVPENVYKMVRMTLAELQLKVRPYGAIGKYLFQQMVQYNNDYSDDLDWPQGESWALGDQPTVSLLLEEHQWDYDWVPAPLITRDMYYIHGRNNRPIRVYRNVDCRLTMEDFFAKLALNFPEREA